MKKLLIVPLVALSGLLGIHSVTYADPAPPSQTLTVQVGNGVVGVAANSFLPERISIHKGDTIHFANPYAEPHTVTSLAASETSIPSLTMPNPTGAPGEVFNPLATEKTATNSPVDFDPIHYFNSGFLFKGDSVDVTFNVTGDFKFLCLFHPGMELNLNVSGQPINLPDQTKIDAQAKAESDGLIAVGKAIIADYTLTKTTAGGASTWESQVGGGVGLVDLLSFLPGTIKINTGDSVKWTSRTFTPHTVTFGAAPELFAMTPNVAGKQPAQLQTFAAGAVFPAGGNTYAGSGNVHSGLIDETGGFPAGTSFTLKFTKAGKYVYVCILHEGMSGTIEVSDKVVAPPPAPAPQPIAPPNTGSGPAGSSSSGWLALIALIAVAGAASVAVGATAGKRE